MKLNDLEKKSYAKKALKENYRMNFDVNKLDILATKKLLKKVRTLAMEAKQTSDFYKSSPTPSFMKLVFMEEALVNHYNQLSSRPKPRIVLENEKIEQSQVYLAAQDLVDHVNKMLETVGTMQVKELPALVDSIESEIGVNESKVFQEQVTASLQVLNQALTEVQNSLKTSVNQLTGEEGGGFEQAEIDQSMSQPGDQEAAMGSEMEPAPEEPIEQPEEEAPEETGAEDRIGRAKR